MEVREHGGLCHSRTGGWMNALDGRHCEIHALDESGESTINALMAVGQVEENNQSQEIKSTELEGDDA